MEKQINIAERLNFCARYVRAAAMGEVVIDVPNEWQTRFFVVSHSGKILYRFNSIERFETFVERSLRHRPKTALPRKRITKNISLC